jgi:uronate dehydrogenase
MQGRAAMTDNNKMNRLLLTGAAGGLGKVLRERLKPYANVLRLSDIAALAPAADALEEVVPCDLADKAAVHALVKGCDAIVHLGGVSVERPFEEILEANIKGVFHIYEAARRPDGYYGLSKSFGEDVAQFYFDRWGIETVSIRIGSSFPEPANRRMMSTWLSYRDLTSLIEKSLFTPDVKHTVVYGMSNNRDVWWDNSAAAHLGFVAQDSSEVFRDKVEQQPPVAPTDPNAIYQGGAFTAQGPFGDSGNAR